MGDQICLTQTLELQTAIVTGASRGLGRGIADALAAGKMRVVALARDATRLNVTTKEHAADPGRFRSLNIVRPNIRLTTVAGPEALRGGWRSTAGNWDDLARNLAKRIIRLA
jgi:NAD(P)-dependent dehydrogenase (short-subunit alcohol dehydrogenase family)